MSRPKLALLLAIPLLLFACGQGTGSTLLPPYDGPAVTGQPNPTGYQPGSVDIFSVPGGFTGGFVQAHSYEVVVVSGSIDWNTADALAKTTFRNGVAGHLATITSPEENAAVEALRSAAKAGEVWLGGFQPAGSSEPGGGWTWVNGEGSFPGANGGPAYTNWANGEPNDQGGSEQHLTIGRHGPGLWNDLGVSIQGYVVEWDY
jgi:hypothetical protein